jgi:hypothetical protein
MNYLIVNTSLMVKGKNYPEGGMISDSVLTKQDINDLAKFLKPISNNKQTQSGNSTNTTPRNSSSKNSK